MLLRRHDTIKLRFELNEVDRIGSGRERSLLASTKTLWQTQTVVKHSRAHACNVAGFATS
jgi:hypothetical protein